MKKNICLLTISCLLLLVSFSNAQMNRTNQANNITSNVYQNSTHAITGAALQSVMLNQNNSYTNILSDTLLFDVRSFSVSQSYTPGMGCFYGDTLFKDSIAHSGAWNRNHFIKIASRATTSGGGSFKTYQPATNIYFGSVTGDSAIGSSRFSYTPWSNYPGFSVGFDDSAETGLNFEGGNVTGLGAPHGSAFGFGNQHGSAILWQDAIQYPYLKLSALYGPNLTVYDSNVGKTAYSFSSPYLTIYGVNMRFPKIAPATGQVLTDSVNGTTHFLYWKTPAPGISGSGTINYIPVFTGPAAFGNSHIMDGGGNQHMIDNSSGLSIDWNNRYLYDIRGSSGSYLSYGNGEFPKIATDIVSKNYVDSVTGFISGLTGSGTTNYVPVFNSSSVLVNSHIIDGGGSLQMLDNTSNLSLDWGNRLVYDASGSVTSVNWGNRLMYDASGSLTSLDWNNRYLYTSGGDYIGWGDGNSPSNSYDVVPLGYANSNFTGEVTAIQDVTGISGGGSAVSNGSPQMVLQGSGVVTSYTVTFPSSTVVNGSNFNITTNVPVYQLTFSGATANYTPSFLAANTSWSWIYDASLSEWISITQNTSQSTIQLLANYTAAQGNAINLNTTSDQTINLNGGTTFIITDIIITNVSATPANADDGEWWSGTGRTGAQYFFTTGNFGTPCFQYFTSSTVFGSFAVNSYRFSLSAGPIQVSFIDISQASTVTSPLYFSLGIAEGTALTCDMYIYGYVLN